MIYIRQCFFLRRNQLLAAVQFTGVYSLNKQRSQLLLNKQDTFKIGLQRILYVVLDRTRHRPKAKSFRLLQHSSIDNILNFSTLFFSMQTNGFFFLIASAAGVPNFSSYVWEATYKSERATMSF